MECAPIRQERKVPIFHWDGQALSMVTGIEKSIIALDLDSQGQFIAITNAIAMQSNPELTPLKIYACWATPWSLSPKRAKCLSRSDPMSVVEYPL